MEEQLRAGRGLDRLSLAALRDRESKLRSEKVALRSEVTALREKEAALLLLELEKKRSEPDARQGQSCFMHHRGTASHPLRAQRALLHNPSTPTS